MNTVEKLVEKFLLKDVATIQSTERALRGVSGAATALWLKNEDFGCMEMVQVQLPDEDDVEDIEPPVWSEREMVLVEYGDNQRRWFPLEQIYA